jgi:hypothetical protein
MPSIFKRDEVVLFIAADIVRVEHTSLIGSFTVSPYPLGRLHRHPVIAAFHPSLIEQPDISMFLVAVPHPLSCATLIPAISAASIQLSFFPIAFRIT